MERDEEEENKKEFYQLFTLDIWRTLIANMNGTLGLIAIIYFLNKLLNYIAVFEDPGLALCGVGFMIYMLMRSMSSLTQRMRIEYKAKKRLIQKVEVEE